MESLVKLRDETQTNFWQNKRVIITGHTGFKGTWLSTWLGLLGAKLCGISLAPDTTPSLFELTNMHKRLTSHIVDVRNYDQVEKIFREFNPEIVIHMAAQPLVRESYKNPSETYSTNVMGTVNVLEACRSCIDLRAIVCVTTDKVYENKEWYWGYRENEAMGGHDPYSSSKGCTELVCSAYRRSFFSENKVSLATARAGNVIGGGDWSKDRLIPDILRALEKQRVVEIRNPHAIRPWQHVLEPLSGYLDLAKALYCNGERFSGAWNFGPEDSDALSVNKICEKLISSWGSNAEYQIQAGNHPHEAQYLKLDISKVKRELGWRPRWDLHKAIEMIVRWHKAFLNEECVISICEEQIIEFCGAQ